MKTRYTFAVQELVDELGLDCQDGDEVEVQFNPEKLEVYFIITRIDTP